MNNLFSELRELFPGEPLLIGEVTAVDQSSTIITLLGGGEIMARGSGDWGVGDNVYIRGGVVEGLAPSLPFVDITI